MVLDMYANTSTRRRLNSGIDFPIRETDEQLHRWRKHSKLHGWMQQLYREKGGFLTFNCANVQLTSKDIDDLEMAIRRGKLPATFGFLFGESTGKERADDLVFVAKARLAIATGLKVYYYSCW